MTPQRHQHIMEVFAAAVEQPAEARAAWLALVCGDDLELRAQVESLLACDHSNGALDQPPLGSAVDLSRLTTAQEVAPPVPDRIDKFEILGLLGSGGMGVVYRARQDRPSRIVALKLIRPDLATPASRRRFQIEMETLARLRHPGIAAIHEAGTVTTAVGQQPYIAMEYVVGPPLLEFAASQALNQPDRVELLARLCDAVEHAHRRGVIHRDLKPANILVEEVDGVPQPRVLDFGVARLTDPEARATTAVTVPGQVLGTLAYMSPEQMDGDPHALDTRSDVYSLGVIAYELLCGKLPIDISSTSVYAAVRTVRETPPKPLYEHDRKLRGDLNTIVLKALAKNRDERYDSAAALAADLRRYVAGEPITARPPSTLYLLRKFAARHRALVAGVSLVLICLLGGVVGTSYGLIQARRAQARLEARIRQMSDTAAFLAREVTVHLGPVAGTTDVRRRLLERLTREVDDLLLQSPEDERLLTSKAAVLTQRSDISLSEGRLDEALAWRRAALALYERLAALRPAVPERQADLSIALVKVGDAYKAREDVAAARDWYEQAAAIDERLMRAHPESRRYLDNLAWSCDRLGDLAQRNQEVDRAEGYLRRRLELNERLLALEPDNLTTLHGLWETYFLLGRMTPDAASRAPFVRQALELSERLIVAAPHNALYLKAHIAAHLEYALLVAGGAPDEARTHLEEVTRRGKEYIELEPTNVEGYEFLTVGLLNRGREACKAGNLEQAQLMHESVVELCAVVPREVRLTYAGRLAELADCLSHAAHSADQPLAQPATPPK